MPRRPTVAWERFGGGPVKLDDCNSHGRGSGAELFVVEGDSAAAAVSRVRNAAFQAVLPMQGKPLNPLRAPAAKVATHPLFAALAAALGTGLGADEDPGSLRYGRILLLMDPDADGIHCGALLVMFFHRFLPRLLDAGRVAIVRPPWGEVAVPGEPEPRHAFSEAGLTTLAARLRERGPVAVRRYRGLAAIEAAMLSRTCVVPATRRVETVTTADAATMIAMLGPIATGDGM